MKKNILYSFIISSLLLVGCESDFLDPDRSTNVLTHEDFENVQDNHPDLFGDGSLNGIASFMVRPTSITTQHYDFGQKGVDIWLDILSGDMALSASSYGWYNNTANLVSTVNETATENRIIWDYYYKIISLTNKVIMSSGGNNANPSDPDERVVLGQAKSYRAYAYFYLAQLFQKEYNPGQAILPFYDGENDDSAKVPASKIYDLILSDLNDAVELLSSYNRSNQEKQKINADVAHGLLAYTYAAMGNNLKAKEHADAVVDSGSYPLTTKRELVYRVNPEDPTDNNAHDAGFNNLDTKSWIWGFDLTEDLGHQLIDWWGQMDYFTYSYAAFGDRKSMDNQLYAQISDQDIRKEQFPAGFLHMPVNKFFHQDRVQGQQYTITTDLLFMRVEEFYLLSAEAAAKIGDEATAKNRLVDLLEIRLESNCDAEDEDCLENFDARAEAEAYVSNLSGQDLLDEIYLQTRIELWGEGKIYFAVKRNKKTITRGDNHVFRAGESFSHDSDEMSFLIPRRELDNNPFIDGQN